MKSVLLQPTVIIASLFILALVGGGSYAAVRIYSNEQNKDAVVKKAAQLGSGHASAEQIAAELAEARVLAQKESDRLNLFVNYPTSPEALGAVREEVYENVLNDFDKKIEAVAKKVAKADATDTNRNIQTEIARERAEIQEILKKWQELVNNPALNSSSAAATLALEYANQIQTNINDIKNIVGGLTPENSGLTVGEIAANNSDIASLITTVNQAITDLGQTTVPPTIITEQQNDTTTAENNVTILGQALNDANNSGNGSGGDSSSGSQNGSGNNQTGDQGQTTDSTGNGNTSGGGSTSGSNPPTGDYTAPNYPGTRYVPPLPTTDPSKPKLIEGANSGVI